MGRIQRSHVVLHEAGHAGWEEDGGGFRAAEWRFEEEGGGRSAEAEYVGECPSDGRPRRLDLAKRVTMDWFGVRTL